MDAFSPVRLSTFKAIGQPGRAPAFAQRHIHAGVVRARDGADIDELKVASIYVDQGPSMKRMRARAKGRGNRILKRTSHITVTVADS